MLYFLFGAAFGLFIGREIACRTAKPHYARMEATVKSLISGQPENPPRALIETLRGRSDALRSSNYMGHWNAWVHYIGQGGKSDWPREAYKNEIAFDAELIRAAIAELSRRDDKYIGPNKKD